MSSLLSCFFIFLFLMISSSSSAAATISPLLLQDPTPADDKPTAYEALLSYDFPVGIIPKGALGYDLDPATGDFSAYFNSTCSFSIEGSYELRYQPTVSGHVAVDRLDRLTGVSVKVLFFWLNIIEVVRSGDQLVFSVGITSADFGVDNFYESPQCGCGFDCDSGGAAQLEAQ